MVDAPTTRRLAAILASDVVGYSRLMAADESGTLTALKRHRETVFDPTVAANNGRIVKLIGDGALVEFGSVVDAVNCALAIQRTIAAETSAAGQITLRIGINLGDVIIEGDDLYGDGVNVASRLEPLAEPGGICVASIVNESVGSRVDATFDAALQHGADAELLADDADVDMTPLVGEAGVPGDHDEPGDLGEIGDDVLGDAVREIFLLGVSRHVGEGQDGDRGRRPRRFRLDGRGACARAVAFTGR